MQRAAQRCGEAALPQPLEGGGDLTHPLTLAAAFAAGGRGVAAAGRRTQDDRGRPLVLIEAVVERVRVLPLFKVEGGG